MTIINSNDPRVKRTRELIINAFIAVLSKKGFDSITINDITDAATINRATFYSHFTDKYDLLDTIVVEKFTEIFSKKIQGELSFNEQVIRILILCTNDYFELMLDICKCGLSSILLLVGNTIIDKLESIIYELLKKDRELSEIEHEKIKLLGVMIGTSIYNAIYKWKINKMQVSLEVLEKQILSFVFTGAGTL